MSFISNILGSGSSKQKRKSKDRVSSEMTLIQGDPISPVDVGNVSRKSFFLLRFQLPRQIEKHLFNNILLLDRIIIQNLLGFAQLVYKSLIKKILKISLRDIIRIYSAPSLGRTELTHELLFFQIFSWQLKTCEISSESYYGMLGESSVDPEAILAQLEGGKNKHHTFQAQLYYEHRRCILALSFIFLSVLLESCAFHTVIFSFIPVANNDPYAWTAVKTLDIITLVYVFQYSTAFITSWLSDTYFARFWTIFVGYVIYILGYVILIISQSANFDNLDCEISNFVHHGPDRNDDDYDYQTDKNSAACSPLLVTSLFIIGLGSGVLSGNMIIFGADQTNSAEMAPKFFHILYWMMRFGAVVSCYVISYGESFITHKQLWPLVTAFGCLCLSMFIFVCGRARYIYRERQPDMTQTLTKVISASFSDDTKRRQRREREG